MCCQPWWTAYKYRPAANNENINFAATYSVIWTRVHIHVNGKQENWWTRVESRLLAMLEGEASLSLEQLNLATQAWVT